MKYIRTEDNRIIKIDEKGCIKEFEILKQKKLYAFKDSQYSYRYENGKEVKQIADIIEELCDEFVVVFEDKNHIVYSQFKWAMDKAMWSGMPFIIYGAVWTDKGLIYVAKMNDTGELELL